MACRSFDRGRCYSTAPYCGLRDRHDTQGIEPGDESKSLLNLACSNVALRHRLIHPKTAFLRIQLDQIIQDLLAPRLSRGSIPKHLSAPAAGVGTKGQTRRGTKPRHSTSGGREGSAGPTRPACHEAATAPWGGQRRRPAGAPAGTSSVATCRSIRPDPGLPRGRASSTPRCRRTAHRAEDTGTRSADSRPGSSYPAGTSAKIRGPGTRVNES